jgi:hypothetical protein
MGAVGGARQRPGHGTELRLLFVVEHGNAYEYHRIHEFGMRSGKFDGDGRTRVVTDELQPRKPEGSDELRHDTRVEESPKPGVSGAMTSRSAPSSAMNSTKTCDELGLW